MREEANDRETTLMNVLKNVTGPHDEQDEHDVEVGAARDEDGGRQHKKSGGALSFFGIKSKSRDNVLGSSDTKLDQEGGGGGGHERIFKKRSSKAKSLEALNHKDGAGKRWGSGIWLWLTKSRERVDSTSSKKEEEEEDHGHGEVKEVKEDHLDEKVESVVRIEGPAAAELAAAPPEALAAAVSDSEISGKGAAVKPKPAKISFDLGDNSKQASASTGDLAVAEKVAEAEAEAEVAQEKSVSVDEGLGESTDLRDGKTPRRAWFSKWSRKGSKEDQDFDQEDNGLIGEELVGEGSKQALETSFDVEEKIDFSLQRSNEAVAEGGESGGAGEMAGDLATEDVVGKKLQAPKWSRPSSKDRQREDTSGQEAPKEDGNDPQEEKGDADSEIGRSLGDGGDGGDDGGVGGVGGVGSDTSLEFSSKKLRSPTWSRPSTRERGRSPEVDSKRVSVAEHVAYREAIDESDRYQEGTKVVRVRTTGAKPRGPSWSAERTRESVSPIPDRIPTPPTIDRSSKPGKKKKKKSRRDNSTGFLNEQQALAISQLEAVLDGSDERQEGGQEEEEVRVTGGRRLQAPAGWSRGSSSRGKRIAGDGYSEERNREEGAHEPKRTNAHRSSKPRSKSASEEPVKARLKARERPLAFYDSSHSIDRDKFRRISEMTDPPTIQQHRSETDLRSSARLPSRKPTTIGSSDDILEFAEEERGRKESAFGKLKLPAFARALSPGSGKQPHRASVGGPTSLPHSLTTPKEEEKARRAAGLTAAAAAAGASSPPSPPPLSPTGAKGAGINDDFHQVRIAGFGVERLQAKMKASPRMKHAALQTEDPPTPPKSKRKSMKDQTSGVIRRMPKSREVKKEDEARILLIEQEIEAVREPTPTSKSSREEDRDDDARGRKKSVSKGTSTDELVVIPKKKTSAQQSSMLARRLGDHNFMKFIKKSGVYGDYKKSSRGRKEDEVSGHKWKGDKIDKAIETPSSEESQSDAARLVRGRIRANSDSSRSSSEGGGTRIRRASEEKHNKYYLSRADGTILYAFESESPKRGRSYDELHSIT